MKKRLKEIINKRRKEALKLREHYISCNLDTSFFDGYLDALNTTLKWLK